MGKYLKANQAMWDECVEVHFGSKFYDVDGFRAGKSTLDNLVREEVGDVAGKSLVHLQCHFGLDTLSWARLGANVTGLDFAPKAIESAAQLAAELAIDADFICADIYEIEYHISQGKIKNSFDIVFTSYGVLTWLPDLKPWAKAIARLLKPGGVFHVLDLHPFTSVFEYQDGKILVKYPYFSHREPMMFDQQGTYADRNAHLENTIGYEWNHSLGEITNSLIEAGLTIEFIHEFPFCMYKRFDCLVEGRDGFWRFPEGDPHSNLPMLFSLKARK